MSFASTEIPWLLRFDNNYSHVPVWLKAAHLTSTEYGVSHGDIWAE
jgi:hypothetical protein